MALPSSAYTRRVRVTGFVIVGPQKLHVPHETTVRHLLDHLGEPFTQQLVKEGRVEKKSDSFELVYTLEPS